MPTRATTDVKDGEYWILNGSKNFITHISGDVTVVMLEQEKGDSHGMTAFVIEKVWWFFIWKEEDKLGMRASETANWFW